MVSFSVLSVFCRPPATGFQCFGKITLDTKDLRVLLAGKKPEADRLVKCIKAIKGDKTNPAAVLHLVRRRFETGFVTECVRSLGEGQRKAGCTSNASPTAADSMRDGGARFPTGRGPGQPPACLSNLVGHQLLD